MNSGIFACVYLIFARVYLIFARMYRIFARVYRIFAHMCRIFARMYCIFAPGIVVDVCDRGAAYRLFRGAFEMWLRSRCGGDMDETQISTDLLTLSSYLDYAVTNTADSTRNLYELCDEAYCDYQLVYSFLLDMKQQAKVGKFQLKQFPCRVVHDSTRI